MSDGGEENPPKNKSWLETTRKSLASLPFDVPPFLTDYSSKLNTTLSTTSNSPFFTLHWAVFQNSQCEIG